jgi:hypothetical protein
VTDGFTPCRVPRRRADALQGRPVLVGIATADPNVKLTNDTFSRPLRDRISRNTARAVNARLNPMKKRHSTRS